MRKITFKIEEGSTTKNVEFITDRTAEWTMEQYQRNKEPMKMVVIDDSVTTETTQSIREV
mgnify:FL=1